MALALQATIPPQVSSKKCDRLFQRHHKRTMAENLGDYRVLLVGLLGAN